jgi:nucleoside phosphorylase
MENDEYNYDYTALIMTAIKVEYEAVLEFIGDNYKIVTSLKHSFLVGDFRTDNSLWKIVLPTEHKGNVSTAAMTALAIPIFKPDVVLFVGVAGGVYNVKPGDVVAAERVHYYGPKKESKEGSQLRPRSSESRFLIETAKNLVHSSKWKETAIVAPIVASEIVLATKERRDKKTLSVYEEIRNTYNDAVAVETEGYGMMEAVGLFEGTQGLVIRGISDLIFDESEKGVSWNTAAKNACSFAFDLIKEYKQHFYLSYLAEESAPLQEGTEIALGENIMYRLGKDIAHNSKRFLVIFQRTPSLLLGPEPLEKKSKNKWDKELIDALDDCVIRTQKENFQFIYLYSLAHTLKRLNQLPLRLRENFKETVIKNIKKYHNIQERSNERFKISQIDDVSTMDPLIKFCGPVAISDSETALWLAERDKGEFRKMLVPRLKSRDLSFRLYKELVNMIAPSPSSLDKLLEGFRGM